VKKQHLRFILNILVPGLLCVSLIAASACSSAPSSSATQPTGTAKPASSTLPSSSAPASPNPPPKPAPSSITGGTAYQNTTWKYTVQLLPGWTVDSTAQENVVIRSADQKADIAISSNQSGLKLEGYIAYGISSFKEAYPTYKEQSRSFITLAGLPASAIECTYTKNGIAMQSLMLQTVKDQYGYALIGSANQADYAKYGGDLAAMMYSLKLN
jgi:hypothetical protein